MATFGRMPNLVIDHGNTNCKIATFNERQLVDIQLFESSDSKAIEGFINSANTDRGIYASVSDQHLNLEPHILTFDSSMSLPFEMSYDTPETLGLDRIAAAAGAYAVNTESDHLVIDIGTCMTVDVLSAQNGFEGGSIAPGLHLRLKSMHEGTGRLPLIEEVNPTGWIGKSTVESMTNGSVNGMEMEIMGRISRFHDHYPNGLVHLTGGDMELFAEVLKNHIFADPNLVLKGLNEILLFN